MNLKDSKWVFRKEKCESKLLRSLLRHWLFIVGLKHLYLNDYACC